MHSHQMFIQIYIRSERPLIDLMTFLFSHAEAFDGTAAFCPDTRNVSPLLCLLRPVKELVNIVTS